MAPKGEGRIYLDARSSSSSKLECCLTKCLSRAFFMLLQLQHDLFLLCEFPHGFKRWVYTTFLQLHKPLVHSLETLYPKSRCRKKVNHVEDIT